MSNDSLMQTSLHSIKVTVTNSMGEELSNYKQMSDSNVRLSWVFGGCPYQLFFLVINKNNNKKNACGSLHCPQHWDRRQPQEVLVQCSALPSHWQPSEKYAQSEKNKTHKKTINKTNTGQLKHFEASHLKNNKEPSPPPK